MSGVINLSNKDDYTDQQTLLSILYKIKEAEPTLTLAECAVILCDAFDIEYKDFASKCGKIVKSALKDDAMANGQLKGRRKDKKFSIDSLF